jgi:hypothetical protein
MTVCGRCGNPTVFCDCINKIEVVVAFLLAFAFWLSARG